MPKESGLKTVEVEEMSSGGRTIDTGQWRTTKLAEKQENQMKEIEGQHPCNLNF